MRSIIIIVLIVVFNPNVYAQKEHIIRLKNGSEIRGKIVYTDSSSTRIETRTGSVWSFQSNEIAGIENFVPKVSGKGVFLRAEFGIAGGSQISPSVLFVNGYSFDSHWDLGLAVGYEHFWGWGYVPILVNGRYNILNNHITPYVDILAGYEMPLSDWDNNKGGLSTGARLGVTRYFGNRLGFSTSLGYRFAYLKETNWWWDDNVTLRVINRFELKFALTFK
ncbi:MAG: hypothetical protein HUJ25_11615 [Crocinitomicaceae bacterium]|nr:hypothetical protein [Crocinitomicaceae bacterium]